MCVYCITWITARPHDMYAFPGSNLTAGCLEDADCFAGGKCEPSQFTEQQNYSVCRCPYRNPLDRCATTYFDALGNHVLIYTGIGIGVFTVFFLLFLFEIMVDLRLRKRSLPILSKIALLVFTLFRLVHFSMWTYSSLYGMPSLLPLVDTLLRTLGIVCLGTIGYLVVCIAWCNMLLKAKKLGDNSKRVKILRTILSVVVCVVTPTTIVINAVTTVYPETPTVALVGNFIGSIVIIVAFGTTFYLLTIVIQWTKKLREMGSEFASKRLLYIIRKNKFLMGNNAALVLTLTMVVVFSTVPRDLPYVAIVTEGTTRLVEVFSLICQFGFLETYFVSGKQKFLAGYYYGLLGHSSVVNTPGTNSSLPPSHTPSSSKTTETPMLSMPPKEVTESLESDSSN